MYHYAGNNPIKYTDPDGRLTKYDSSLRLDKRNEEKTPPSSKMLWGIALTIAGHILDKGGPAIAAAVALASGGSGALLAPAILAGCEALGVTLEAVGVALTAEGIIEASAEIADAVASQVQYSSSGDSDKSYREKTRNANANDRKQVDSVAKKFKIDRREFGDFIEQTKQEMGRGPSDNFSYSELEDLAREFLELN